MGFKVECDNNYTQRSRRTTPALDKIMRTQDRENVFETSRRTIPALGKIMRTQDRENVFETSRRNSVKQFVHPFKTCLIMIT